MGFSILFIFILCGIYVQNRGTIQHERFTRKITDHSNIMAPINCLFYAFSSIKNTAYIDPRQFPELKILEETGKLFAKKLLRLTKHLKLSLLKNMMTWALILFFVQAGNASI